MDMRNNAEGIRAAVVRVEAPNLVYRQTCRDACDELTIDYDAPPRGGAAVSVSGADRRAVFSGGTYDDAGQTHRLSAGPGRTAAHEPSRGLDGGRAPQQCKWTGRVARVTSRGLRSSGGGAFLNA